MNKYPELQNDITSIVEEVSPSYNSPDVFEFQDIIADKFLLVKLIQKGLPYSFFAKLKQFFPFTIQEWSDYFDISLKSLQRYHNDQRRFKPIHSEKIIELAEVVYYGLDVFEDMDRFKLWLDTPSFALGSMKPIDLLRDSYGKDLVMNELVALEYGIFA